MTIELVNHQKEKIWNEFIIKNSPPVGSFMQSWEWGAFNERLGRKVERYFVLNGDIPIAAFTLVHQLLPFGMKYGYTPRGPIIASPTETKFIDVCTAIQKWALQEFPDFVFLRLEPPLLFSPPKLPEQNFRIPRYYIQPRYNSVVELSADENEIISSFHSSTRSNLGRAERRGVTVKIKNDVSKEEYAHFAIMMKNTCSRNYGKKIYPSEAYFKSLFSMLLPGDKLAQDPLKLYLVPFYGFCNNQPAATHFVLFFGNTATYLYGASYSDHLNSKVTTYLHWAGIQEAKRKGMRYYDFGAIDDKRWPSLTDFKRQFNGKEFHYMGNIDIPIRKASYNIYNLLRRFRR